MLNVPLGRMMSSESFKQVYTHVIYTHVFTKGVISQTLSVSLHLMSSTSKN